MFCGLIKYDNETNKPRVIEWEGSCVLGECRICTGWLAPNLFSLCPDGRVCTLYGNYYGVGVAFSFTNSLLSLLFAIEFMGFLTILFCFFKPFKFSLVYDYIVEKYF
jgi:hypothetical protein